MTGSDTNANNLTQRSYDTMKIWPNFFPVLLQSHLLAAPLCCHRAIVWCILRVVYILSPVRARRFIFSFTSSVERNPPGQPVTAQLNSRFTLTLLRRSMPC